MEKIQQLLAKLENKVSPSIKRRLSGFNKLKVKLELVKSEHEQNPTDESFEELQEIEEYVMDVQEDLIEDLEHLVELKEQNTAIEPVEENSTLVKPIEAKPIEKEGSNNGFGLVFGAILLVGSFGLINYFRNNK